MNCRTLASLVIISSFGLFPAFGKPAKQVVAFSSPCVSQGAHGKDRWPAKTDPDMPPTDRSKVRSITPSQMFGWPGVGASAHLTRQSPRIASEQRWFALTGQVTDVKVEGDGDIHIELVDANGKKTGTVGVEIPPGKRWCKFRELVFSWTSQNFPFNYPSHSRLKLQKKPVITVTGKAFYDVDHAPKDFSNERGKPFAPGFSVWEVHPVMGLAVRQ
jgi:hypothetical protein